MIEEGSKVHRPYLPGAQEDSCPFSMQLTRTLLDYPDSTVATVS